MQRKYYKNIIDFRKRHGITKCTCCGGAFGNSDHYNLCKKCWDDKLKSLPGNMHVKPYWKL
jgi:Zn finger protein HypA/HybF involved in hydrogenase expression